MTVHDWLQRLIEDIALAHVDAGTRRDLLVDALAPLGPAEAGRQADTIEAHAHWVRTRDHVGRADQYLHDAADVAAYRAALALAQGVAA